ncbi:aldehyde ferredoxin oxidoreductase [candidate division Kazan bacterium]|uniref:Aldehyde ferredoxin oxidoreductase n=1 Tax=candidate division Kazan bacterium TaxID=2202143 RepID=A0A420ZB84_UNCK3|nr:MAG: aldehyde ferredoxin oxidoreductase [candidate division Kazan bacterium]
MKIGGYCGKIARVNLSNFQVKYEDLRWKWVPEYIGGKGLGFRYLYEELEPHTDPLGPKNKLIFMTGPLSGTVAPATGKYVVITKSPHTGTILDSYFGGTFGAQLKFAGFDALIVEGRSEKPVYIDVEDGKVEVKSASHLWGMGAYDTINAIKKEKADRRSSVLAIGPAGEKLVKIASINVDIIYNAGRGGAGAVMGSKKLKAIAVKGHGRVTLADEEEFRRVAKELTEKSVLSEANIWAKTDGTPVIVDISNAAGVLTTRYFRSGVFENHDKINTDVVKAHLAGVRACYACPLACKKLVKVRDRVVKAPEYETLATAGSNCGIGDFEAVVDFNYLCGDLGIDTISTANTIAFIMQLYEEGILRKEDLDGIEANFGNKEALLKLTDKIGRNEGVGKIFSDGVRAAIKKLRLSSRKYAIDVKGLEIPAYDPRGTWGMALAYSTSDRGACHLRAWAVSQDAFGKLEPKTFKGKPAIVKDLEDLNSVKWSLIICDCWLINYEEMAALLTPVWGRTVKPNELKLIGERIWNLGRLFNVREGFSRKDDMLPDKFFEQPLLGGPTNGAKVSKEEFEEALKEYYALRGWNMEGIPEEKTLNRLNLKLDLANLPNLQGK